MERENKKNPNTLLNYLQLTGLDKKIAYSIQKTTVAVGEEKTVVLERYTTVDCKDVYTILDSNINYKRKIWESYIYSEKFVRLPYSSMFKKNDIISSKDTISKEEFRKLMKFPQFCSSILHYICNTSMLEGFELYKTIEDKITLALDMDRIDDTIESLTTEINNLKKEKEMRTKNLDYNLNEFSIKNNLQLVKKLGIRENSK